MIVGCVTPSLINASIQELKRQGTEFAHRKCNGKILGHNY